VKPVYSASLSLSFFTLAALAGFGSMAAAQVPARGDDRAAAAAVDRSAALAKNVTIYRDTFGVPHASSASSMPRPKITSGKSRTTICARSAAPPRCMARNPFPTTS
jgi:hypothetical protein